MDKINPNQIAVMMGKYSLEKQNVARLIWNAVLLDEPGCGIRPAHRELAYENIHDNIGRKPVKDLEYLHGDMIAAIHEFRNRPSWAELPPVPE